MTPKKPNDDDDDGIGRRYVNVSQGASKRRITREEMNKLLKPVAKKQAQAELPTAKVAVVSVPPQGTLTALERGRLAYVAADAARRKADAERRAQYKPGFDDLLRFVNRPNVQEVFNKLVQERMPEGISLSKAARLMGLTTKGGLINTMRGERAWSAQMLKKLIIWLGGSDEEWLATVRHHRTTAALKAKRNR